MANHAANDPVNNPSHYTAYEGLEIIDLTEQMNFNRGNAVKYITRAGLKDPATELEDLDKARWYIEREMARVEKRQAKENVLQTSTPVTQETRETSIEERRRKALAADPTFYPYKTEEN